MAQMKGTSGTAGLGNLVYNRFFLQERRRERVDEDRDEFCVWTKWK